MADLANGVRKAVDRVQFGVRSVVAVPELLSGGVSLPTIVVPHANNLGTIHNKREVLCPADRDIN